MLVCGIVHCVSPSCSTACASGIWAHGGSGMPLEDVEQQNGGLHGHLGEAGRRNLAQVETEGRPPDPAPGLAEALAPGLVRGQEDRPGLARIVQEAPERGARARGIGRLERVAPGLLAQLAELPQPLLGRRAGWRARPRRGAAPGGRPSRFTEIGGICIGLPPRGGLPRLGGYLPAAPAPMARSRASFSVTSSSCASMCR